ncbi:restriction endonuclease [Amylibacter sp. SFDW26]|uniref:HNH endonuclease n=1 Tax=Amylibacter sp. SFDW26 TaxID=2652722 RepID=UPI001261501F|nr:HNH endonuclease [Amylibacter sp. SFDW26]KAB7610199.1 restriction endonuclease [Amylibacter sp. SFDW26]
MAFGVFIHRRDSIYEDYPSEQYQFPSQYLSRAKNCEGDWIIYYEPTKAINSKGYFAVAKVQEIIADPNHEGMYLAIIENGTYLDFGEPVEFRPQGEVIESGLLNEKGGISGRAQAAIRNISPYDFARITEIGLSSDEEFLPRVDVKQSQFSDAQTPFEHPVERARVEHITNRVVRDKNFRKSVLRAYGERCAISGLKLINGGGRAEVEAAHIRPVKDNGPDIISNGLALSGTLHWMFDRGLIGIGDDLEILISRHVNNLDSIRPLINDTGELLTPNAQFQKPRLDFIQWHRSEYFKD